MASADFIVGFRGQVGMALFGRLGSYAGVTGIRTGGSVFPTTSDFRIWAI
jgi:hypothetical protein